MCTFVDQKLTFNTATEEKSINYEVFLKPTPEKEYYRFRLLWFTDSTDRKTPYVERFIHSVWVNGDGEAGKNVCYNIVCPTTPFVKKTWAGNPFDDCPLCRFANNNYVALKDSGFKDVIAREKNKTFKRKFQAIIPVYVVSDPVYDANNGKFKVFSITDKEIFEKFKALVIERNATTTVFNGKNAVDFLVRVDTVQKVIGENTKNEFRYTKREIVQMGFSSKAYDIPAIDKTAVDQFPFSALYYQSPTSDELKDFYKAHCLLAANDDVDDSNFANLSTLTVTAPPANENVANESTSSDKSTVSTDNEKAETPDIDDGLVESVVGSDDADELPDSSDSQDGKNELLNTSPAIDVDGLLSDIGL